MKILMWFIEFLVNLLDGIPVNFIILNKEPKIEQDEEEGQEGQVETSGGGIKLLPT